MAKTKLTKAIARKVLSVVDAGLVRGVGNPEPGQMCVEAAVCYALGEKHGDNPSCVSPAVRALKIRLNDSNWSSDQARAKGLRRLAIAQLGTRGVIVNKEFAKRVAEIAIRKMVPLALRAAADLHTNDSYRQALRDAANRCEIEGTASAAWSAARSAESAEGAASAAWSAARSAERAARSAAWSAESAGDKTLSIFAEEVVQLLIELKAPGCKWLDLTEAA